ncbi:MAG: lysozyme [Mesosutterella sp.]|nr:lysozyme [Mesosutterella sp.]
MNRYQIAAMTVSAATLVGIAGYEGYSSVAYVPMAGDAPTIGWGTTGGVKKGDTIQPTQALQRLYRDAETAKAGISKCVKVPLAQNELDAYLSLAYNIGPSAFCKSTLVKKLNRGDYKGACSEIRRWSYFKGKRLPGLAKRREAEFKTCMRRQT